MHVALLTHSLPQANSNGGPMTCWAVMRSLLDLGHEVTVIALAYRDDPFMAQEREASIESTGARLRLLPVDEPAPAPAGKGVVDRLFPRHVALRPQLARLLYEVQPDAAFVYHWDTLATTYGMRDLPRLAAVGDPWHLPQIRRWQTTKPRLNRGYAQWTASILKTNRLAPRAMVELLNDSADAGCFQAAEAAWLRKHGASRCDYLASPLIDPGEPPPRERHDGPFRILVGPSNLATTSTRAGLRLLGNTILPGLERELGVDAFRIRVVGEGEPPAELAKHLPHPSVELPGRVEPPAGEFRRCDAQLVPTPFRLGVRLRIVEGLSHGCCVVAHASEAENMPELRHEDNVLLGHSGYELVEHLVRLAGDPELRAQLSRSGRIAYEQNFHPDVAARAIVRRIEALVPPS